MEVAKQGRREALMRVIFPEMENTQQGYKVQDLANMDMNSKHFSNPQNTEIQDPILENMEAM